MIDAVDLVVPGEKPWLIREVGLALNRRVIDASIQLLGERADKTGCVLAGAAGERLYPRFGVGAHATPVDMFTLDAQAYAKFVSGELTYPRRPVVPFAETAPTWRGHLGLDADGYFVDPAAGQVARPSEGRLIPDVLIVPPERRPTDVDGFAEVPAGDEWTVLYRLAPENVTYRDSPVWSDERLIAWITEHAYRDVRAALSERHQPVVGRARPVRPPAMAWSGGPARPGQIRKITTDSRGKR